MGGFQKILTLYGLKITSIIMDTLLLNENPSDVDPWIRLFVLPKCILFSPHQNSWSFWRDSMRVVKQRVRRWTAVDFMGLWSKVCNVYGYGKQFKAKKQKKISESSLLSSNSIQSGCAVEEGQYMM